MGSIDVTQSERSSALDLVRVVAAAMVLVCHVSIYRGDGQLVGMKNGVMLFFALSGYLLYRPFVRGSVDLRRYGIARVARILPAYVIVLIGVTLLTGDRTFADRPAVYLLFLQNYEPGLWSRFVGVSWTLVVEVSFYVTLPLLAAMIGRRALTLVVISIASFLLSFELFGLAPLGPEPSATLYPAMIWAFAPGMLVALLQDRLPRRTWPLLAVGVGLVGLGAALNSWTSMDLVTAIGSGFIVAWAVAAQLSFGRLSPLIGAGAAVSYSVYLWHVDVLKTLPNAWFGVGATLAIAAAVYVLAERPMIRLGRRLAVRISSGTTGEMTPPGLRQPAPVAPDRRTA